MDNFPQRGEIWLVSLDPAVGSEIKKTRPAFVISNNINNRYANHVTLLPVTDKGEKIYPFEVYLPPSQDSAIKKPSKIKCQQIRTVDKSRLLKRLGMSEINLIPEVERALKNHLGFIN